MLFDKFIPVLYVQISPDRLTLRNVKTGEFISEVPEIAISYDKKEQIVGLGNEARSHALTESVRIVNPFSHPRTLVSDFTSANQLLKFFSRRLLGHSILFSAPKVVLHPQGNPDGGFTQIEIRALKELILGAGAYQAIIWQGQELTDQEILSGKFPSGGQVLS